MTQLGEAAGKCPSHASSADDSDSHLDPPFNIFSKREHEVVDEVLMPATIPEKDEPGERVSVARTGSGAALCRSPAQRRVMNEVGHV